MITDGQPVTDELLDALEGVVNSDLNPVKYLSIDPGKSNGVCGYDAKFYLQFMYTISSTDINKFIHRFKKVETCILEDYVLYPNKSKEQVYSDMETSRVIGRVESWAELNKVKLIKQGASIKNTGYAWLGEKPPSKSNKANHKMDAHVHFMFWAIKNGHVNARILLQNKPTF